VSPGTVKRKRIVFVNRYFYPDHSATSQILSDLAFRLSDAGYEVFVITSRQRYDDAMARLPAAEEIHRVQVRRVWTSSFGRDRMLGRAIDYLSFYLTAFIEMLWAANRQAILVAKTDPPLIGVLANWAARVRRASLIKWCQDLFPEVAREIGIKGMRGVGFSVLKRLRNASLRAAMQNVVLGDLMRDRLVNEGVDPAKITVIPNWASAEDLYPVAPEDNPLRAEWGLKGQFVVGYSGNLGRVHDEAAIIEAIDGCRNVPDMTFLFIGGGAKLGRVKNFVEKEAVSNVRFFGYQPRHQLAASLSVPDVHLVSLKPNLEGLIVPSKYYGVAAVARPVVFIGSTRGELARIITEHGCGIAVEGADHEGLVATLHHLRRDIKLRIEMGASGRRLFERRYDVNLAAEQWQRLLAAHA